MPALCHAQWTTEQRVLGGIALTAIVIDYGQTLNIAKHPTTKWEYNPLLPEHPSVSQVTRHFVVGSIIGYVALDAMPSEWRTIALRIGTTIQIGVVARNFSLGLNTQF
jgi:hypothetical protein